jgi:hypothetical protein
MGLRTLSFVSLVVAAGVGMVAPAAHAAQPERFHERFLDVENDIDICGINVDFVSEGVFTDLVFFDNEGNFAGFKSTVSGTNTFTADNGKSVVVQFAGQSSEGVAVVDETAGTITFTTTNRGLPEKIMTAGGPVLLRDAGLITFTNTFDLETDEFISSEVIVNRGPHPEADSDFTLFCELFIAALA